MDDTARLADYFQRQIAHYRKMIEEHKTITHLLNTGDLDTAEAMTSAHARESAQLEKEFHALTREWRAGHPSQSSRGELRALASEAATLARELELIVNAAAGNARERRNAVRREWEAIRRGQNVIDSYRAFNDAEPGQIDRNV